MHTISNQIGALSDYQPPFYDNEFFEHNDHGTPETKIVHNPNDNFMNDDSRQIRRQSTESPFNSPLKLGKNQRGRMA